MLKLSAKLLHFFELYKIFVKKYNKPRPFLGGRGLILCD